jgi:hypothetical protein
VEDKQMYLCLGNECKKEGGSMRTMVVILAFAYIARGSVADDFVEQGARISFDAKNFLTFEDVGRATIVRDGIKSVTFGKFIKLHIQRGERTYDVALTNPKYDQDDPRYRLIISNVSEIKYKDIDHVWVISYGHSICQALLFNIDKRCAAGSYYGKGFALSPNSRNIAFYHEYENMQLVFVNDVMVYPNIEGGFTIWEPTARRGSETIRKADKETIAEYLKNVAIDRNAIQSRIDWKGDAELEFEVKEKPKDQANERSVKCRISGISENAGGIDPSKIKTSKTQVATEKGN